MPYVVRALRLLLFEPVLILDKEIGNSQPENTGKFL